MLDEIFYILSDAKMTFIFLPAMSLASDIAYTLNPYSLLPSNSIIINFSTIRHVFIHVKLIGKMCAKVRNVTLVQQDVLED